LVINALAVVAVAVYSLVVSALIAIAIKKTIGLRVSAEEEELGLDLALHGERALRRPRPDVVAEGRRGLHRGGSR
jgi:ammonia channel protein AmtB